MTKEFILKTLLPYKENPELCGFEDDNCKYLTNDNKTCAIGQYMLTGPWQHEVSTASTLFDKYKIQNITIMTEEWLEQNIPYDVANEMQQYHDSIAYIKRDNENYNIPNINRINNTNNVIISNLEKLTGFELNELKL